jgi:flagellar hook-basal body complex protein FliE
MDIKAFDAASAYGKVSGAALAGSGAGGIASGGSFGELLKGMVGDVAEATRKSETVAAEALAHKAGVVDVVTEVSNAEMVVNTVVAVRDKVIQAYQDIMRMPI